MFGYNPEQKTKTKKNQQQHCHKLLIKWVTWLNHSTISLSCAINIVRIWYEETVKATLRPFCKRVVKTCEINIDLLFLHIPSTFMIKGRNKKISFFGDM